MDFNSLSLFLSQASSRMEASWQLSSLSMISGLRVPDFITGKHDSILRADINILWTQWFLESICDPEKFIDDQPPCYAHIIHAVAKEVPTIFEGLDSRSREEAIKQISRLVAREVDRRQKRKRIAFDSAVKNSLWDIYGPEPRCWVCGYKFSAWAISKFLKVPSEDEVPQPQFIDYLKPHGLNRRDFQIEIDHVFPFSDGGDENIENLRLACGWCNTHKSDRTSIYDVGAKPSVVCHPQIGKMTVPHPFWVVRLLSLNQQCEYKDGCDKTVKNAELTVTLQHKVGALNPLNLRVTCLDHDPIGSERFISRKLVEQMLKR